MKRAMIGVLGGMGPVASAETYMQIIRTCQRNYGAVEDVDFPEVMIYNLPLEQFDCIGFQDNNAERVVGQLSAGIKKLETAGASIIIIDCNTVHCFYDRLQATTSAEILNLIDITAKYVRTKGMHKVGVLCSRTSRRLGLYTIALAELGIENFDVTEQEQNAVDAAILAVMADKVGYAECDAVNAVVKRMFESGADAILLGCTEISFLLKERVDENRYIDSQRLAIVSAIEKWHSNRSIL